MNRQRLKGEIVAKFGTQDAFAEAIGWHKNKVSYFITGKRKPDTDEVAKIASTLDLSENMFLEIFLPTKSPSGDNAEVSQ